MKIQSSSISMSGESQMYQSSVTEEKTNMWGNIPADLSERNSLTKEDIIELSEQGKAMLQSQASGITGSSTLELDVTDIDKQKIDLLQRMLEYLTGKKLRFAIPDKIKINDKNLPVIKLPENAKIIDPNANNQGLKGIGRPIIIQQPRLGWGVSYESHEIYEESQKMSFSAQGNIQTSDGRKVSFDMELNMTREFVSRTDISFKAGDAMRDPLVINMDVPSAKLTDRKIQFDIDTDGKLDQISFVGQGSGFLSLDKNGDGVINDGSELFGTGSGDGFKDLAQYDNDKNGWIDENDAIYEKLRIWTKDENGQDKLFALGQKGVGAIYLGSANTDYFLKNDNNATNGQIRKTGVFLNENGSVGTVQHVDIAI